MKFVIDGVRVISKKNSRIMSFRGGRYTNIPSGAYTEFVRDAGYQIMQQWDREVVRKPFALRCEFVMKGKTDTDVDNMFTSVLDLLQTLSVVVNDKLCIEGTMTKKFNGEKYLTTILLEEK